MNRFGLGLIVLLLLTPALWLSAYLYHPKATIGIILTDEVEPWYGEVVDAAFDHGQYGEYFDARVLPEAFDADEVAYWKGEFYRFDFFEPGRVDALKNKYVVDMILFVTDANLNIEDDREYDLWGKADTVTGSAVITTWYAREQTPSSIRFLQHIALHEILHLLGYFHNSWDQSGIMQHRANYEELALAPYYELQLPIRLISYKLGFGQPALLAGFLNSCCFAAVLLPAFIAAELAIARIFTTWTVVKKPPRVISYMSVAAAFLFLTIMNGAYYNLLVVLLVMVYYHLFYYTYTRYRKPRTVEAPNAR